MWDISKLKGLKKVWLDVGAHEKAMYTLPQLVKHVRFFFFFSSSFLYFCSFMFVLLTIRLNEKCSATLL